jgi:BioD-like phosphotransacetylase family protein
MNLKKAKKLFEQIVELCYEIENPRLIETIESIYSEVEDAEDALDIFNSCQELEVIINEEDFSDSEEDAVSEILEIIEKLSE